ncbi:DUF3649 domain-containing protein [Cupriavidus basilensis]
MRAAPRRALPHDASRPSPSHADCIARGRGDPGRLPARLRQHPGLRRGAAWPAWAEAVMTASLLSYAIYTGAALWAFAARSARRAWLGLLAPSAVLLATAAAGHWTRGLP